MVYLYDVHRTVLICLQFSGSLPCLNINEEAMGRALLFVGFE
jgi:hypothetical protein